MISKTLGVRVVRVDVVEFEPRLGDASLLAHQGVEGVGASRGAQELHGALLVRRAHAALER